MKASLATAIPFLLGSANALATPREDVASLISKRSSSLKWAPCDLDLGEEILDSMTEEMDCATLDVPLDYLNSKSSKTIELQLIRAKANKKPFKGSVLYNPGGPGGSGVEAIAGSGVKYRDILGGQFSIIGFDPRGTGRTIPFICDSSSDSNSTTLSGRGIELFSQTDPWPAVQSSWKAWGSTADQCYKSQKEYGRYLGTPYVARDMISIVDALGEDGKLRYWGTSYGTILGQVTASMFPDRIDRALLDSTLLAESYATTDWSSSSRDQESAVRKFFSECVEAGPSACVLANFTGPHTTAEDLDDALESLFQEWINATTLPEGFTEKDLPFGGESLIQFLKGIMTQYLYSPRQYDILAPIINFALQNKWMEAYNSIPASPKGPWDKATDSALGIKCVDSTFRAEDVDDLYSLTQVHLSQGAFADGGVAGRLSCARWKFDSAEKIDTNKLHNVKTNFPVLFVNGMYDAVTPLEDAWEASSRFRKSRVLIHGGVGHGFTAHPSNCTNNVVREYFVDGKLPKVGSYCEPNMSAYEYVASLNKK